MHLDLLTSVFIRIRPRLLNRANAMLGDSDEAQDALQEAFCKLWGRRKSITSEQQAEGLSVTTLRNTCIDNIRRRNSVRIESVEEVIRDVESGEEETSDAAELLGTVERLIASELTERERGILYMRDKAEAEISEIAEEYGLSEANVRLILSRARKKVRECYMELKRQNK